MKRRYNVVLGLLALAAAGCAQSDHLPGVKLRSDGFYFNVTNGGTENWHKCIVYVEHGGIFKTHDFDLEAGKSTDFELTSFYDIDGQRYPRNYRPQDVTVTCGNRVSSFGLGDRG